MYVTHKPTCIHEFVLDIAYPTSLLVIVEDHPNTNKQI